MINFTKSLFLKKKKTVKSVVSEIKGTYPPPKPKKTDKIFISDLVPSLTYEEYETFTEKTIKEHCEDKEPIGTFSCILGEESNSYKRYWIEISVIQKFTTKKRYGNIGDYVRYEICVLVKEENDTLIKRIGGYNTDKVDNIAKNIKEAYLEATKFIDEYIKGWEGDFDYNPLIK